jgi:TonB-dependent SusC/RagA subfamily outer membrane receptor
MLTTAYYFLQVILCSGIMMGYYWLVLRNKRFHHYNRFYLLAIALLVWLVPLIKIHWQYRPVSNDLPMVQLLSVVADNNTRIEAAVTRSGFQWSWEMAAWALYLTVAAVLLGGIIMAFMRLYRLLKAHSCKNVGDVYLILTQAKGTPFSFFRYIFWNEEIDIRSEAGKQILQHELTHVKQKHSVDKIIIQLVLVVGWFNPFFWLLKKEMEMIHEFIADKKAVTDGDTAALAHMLLTAAYPRQQFAMTNPFFFSPIKRRLQMLANNRNPRFSYLRRLVVLPLLAIVVVLFAFRSKEQRAGAPISVATMMEKVVNVVVGNQLKPGISVSNIAMLDRTYTVVVIPGHGGENTGIVTADGTKESTLTLALAKAVKEMNENDNIRIILTRENDQTMPYKQVAALTNQYHPDLVLLLHTNEFLAARNNKGTSAQNPPSGIRFYIPDATSKQSLLSRILASEMAFAMTPLKSPVIGIRSNTSTNYVLNQLNSPSVLIEAGFMSNPADLAKLQTESYRKEMAVSILNGINDYLVKSKKVKTDTVIIKADTITVKDGNKLVIMNEGGKVQVENINKQSNTDLRNSMSNALVIVDGKKIDNEILELIDPSKIQSINILKNESAKALYGEEGKNGVVMITTKKTASPPVESVTVTGYGTRSMTTTAESPSAKSMNGSAGQLGARVGVVRKYPDTLVWLSGASNYKIPSNVWVLIDGEPGNLNDVIPADIAEVRVIKDAAATARYGEAAKNGVIEVVTKKAVEAMKSVEAPELRKKLMGVKLFSEVETLPAFPGGPSAWAQYLERNMRRDLPAQNGAPPGTYRVTVSFLVAADGGISNVTAQNNPGYKTVEEAIRLINKGPRWKPALQNGEPVNYQHKEVFTWVVKQVQDKITNLRSNKK